MKLLQSGSGRRMRPNQKTGNNLSGLPKTWLSAITSFFVIAIPASADSQQLQVTDLTDTAYKVEWNGVSGRTYFLRTSADLDTWTFTPNIEFGVGPHIRLLQSSNNPFYMALQHEDIAGVTSKEQAMAADIDGDGLSNIFELTYDLNPFNTDSDGDSTLDGAEDSDGDGIVNSAEIIPHFEWNAANDTPGNNTWTSTAANTYTWTFDNGNQTPANVVDSRFSVLTKAYAFPGARDQSNTSWDSYSTQPASFEFVIDADADNGVIFEMGQGGSKPEEDGISIDLSQGVLRACISEVSNVIATYTLSAAEKADFIHVVVVADQVNNVLQLYVDGVLRDSQVWTAGDDWSNTNGAGLGGSGSGVAVGSDTGDFSGKMAFFKFYRQALSADEIGIKYQLLGPPRNYNHDPLWKSDPVVKASVPDGSDISGTLSDNVIEIDQDNLTFVKLAGPAWLNVAANGALSGRPPDADAGLNEFSVSVTDGISTPIVATLRITVDDVNNMPVADQITKLNPNSSAVSIVLSGTDWDGDALTYSVVAQPANGTLSGTAPNLTYTPNSGFVGIDRFFFKANDGQADSLVSSCIIYTGNPSAYFAWDAAADMPGNNTWNSTTSNTYNWTFDNGNQSPVGVIGSRFITLSKAYVFPAARDQSATSWDSYGSSQSASFEFVLDVDNDNGIIFESGNNSTDGIMIDLNGGVLRASIAESTSVVVTHTLSAAEKADFIHVVVVADSTGDVLKLYVDGDLKDSEPWTAGNDWSNTNSAGLGGSNTGTVLTDTGDFTGKIANFNFYRTALVAAQVSGNYEMINWNLAPVFTNDPIAGDNADEDASYSATIAGSATDFNGDTLTYAKVDGPTWLSVASNGALSGTPGNDDVGLNQFTVSVSDGKAPAVFAELEINVINTNDAPTFTADPIDGGNVDEDAAYAGALANSVNDVDVGDTLTYSITDGPAWLTVNSITGVLGGTPTSGDVGEDIQFTVRVTDSAAAYDEATLEITVMNTNDLPVFTSNPIFMSNGMEGLAYSASLNGSATDVDGNDLSYAKVDGPVWLGVAANGDLSGVPTSADLGVNTFTVSVDDGLGEPVEATLKIIVIEDSVGLDTAKAIYKFENYTNDAGPPAITETPDLTGNGNDALLTGSPIMVSGVGVSKAIQLNGGSDGLEIVNDSNHQVVPATGQPFSFAFWFNVSEFTANSYNALVSSESYQVQGFRCYVDCYSAGNETLVFQTIESGGAAYLTKAPVSINTWYHVAIVHDGASTAKLYLNGQLVATDDTASMIGSQQTLHLGKGIAGHQPLKGKLDDIYFFEDELSAEEVERLRASALMTSTSDFDGDGMGDAWEITYGLNPYFNDAAEDADGDGLTNLDEFQHGTNPVSVDTDGDGISDKVEIDSGTDPLDPDDPGSINPYSGALVLTPLID